MGPCQLLVRKGSQHKGACYGQRGGSPGSGLPAALWSQEIFLFSKTIEIIFFEQTPKFSFFFKPASM